MKHDYKKGDIIIIDLGLPPNAIKGHEQAKTRPCVVIKCFSSLKMLTVIPCTSQKPNFSFYSIVELSNGSGGLTSDSYVLCHQIRSVSTERVIDKRGTLSSQDQLRINSVLIDILEL
jgi:mRNA interferase MazF